MARFSDEEKAVLRKLLSEDSEETPDKGSKRSEDTEESTEEFVVFRGSASDFLKAFGVTPPSSESGGDEKTDESETSKPPKEEPKAKTRGRYFG